MEVRQVAKFSEMTPASSSVRADSKSGRRRKKRRRRRRRRGSRT
jgi:hypothetical protein